MTVLISIPQNVYLGFLGRCRLTSREYTILRNAVVDRRADLAGGRIFLELACSLEDAELLFDYAKRLYTVGAPYIEEAIQRAMRGGGGASVSGFSHWEYRRSTSGQTWHICSNCALWPTDNFVRANELPNDAEVCNECRARHISGTCNRVKFDAGI